MIFFSDWVIFWGKNGFFDKKKNLSLIILKKGIIQSFGTFGDEQLIYQNKGHIGRLLTLKEFFRLDNFLGEKSFFEKKTLLWVILKKGLSQSLETWWDDHIYSGLRITEKKNSWLSDFCKNYGRFSKIGLYNFFKNTVSGINSYIIALDLQEEYCA